LCSGGYKTFTHFHRKRAIKRVHFGKNYFSLYGNVFSKQRRTMVFNVQKGSDTFFVIFFHIQHELPAGPFHIPAQCKSSIKFMHHTGFKCSQVPFTYGKLQCFPIAQNIQMLHCCKNRQRQASAHADYFSVFDTHI
jgi:hypothetical protein